MSVRIERISIRNFGPIRDLVLVPGDLTLIFGQNEAGKTSCIDAIARALRERVRPGNRKMLENLRDGPGFQGDVDLLLSPDDGGSVLELLREHPSLARLFLVRDGDATLEGGRSWMNSLRGRLIGIDLNRVSEKVRAAAQLTATGSAREARQDERQRLAERLARVDGFLADLPTISRLLEESHQIERQRTATRDRIARLRTAERFERYRLGKRAIAMVESSRRELQDLELYGQADLDAWREAVAKVRETAVIAKSAENETIRALDEENRAGEELHKREAVAEKARNQMADCGRRNLEGLVGDANAARRAVERWSLWRTPLAIAAVLLLGFGLGATLQAMDATTDNASVYLGVLAGAATVLGLVGAGLAIFSTSRTRAARASESRAIAACKSAFEEVVNLEDCASRIASIAAQSERAEAEREAASDRKRAAEESVRLTRETQAQRQQALDAAQGMVADVRNRVRLASIELLEEKIRERTQISSALEETHRTLHGLLGDHEAELPLERRLELLQTEDPGVPPDPHQLAALELECEEYDRRLLQLQSEIAERRDQSLASIGLKDLSAAEAEREQLVEGVATIDAETTAGQLCLQVLRELAQDIDRPLREALGPGPGAAGAYLARFTAGRYTSVAMDGDGRLAVRRDDDSQLDGTSLSRGARDQLALSIRVSLVRRLLGEPGFLALDDAFLTSDPGRREELAGALTDLVAEGWQILYFTFDPELKKLLAGHGARVIELPSPSRSAA